MTYEQIVAAEVAARYGLPVIGAVQIIPRGVSGLPLPWEAGNTWIAQRERQRANEARIRRVVATQEPPAPKTRTPAPRPERLVQRDAQLRQMAAQGMTASAISQRLGITRNAVYAAARKAGVEIVRQVGGRKAKPKPPKVERVKVDHTPRIREMAEAGAGTREISAAIGICRSYVSEIALAAGIKITKRVAAEKVAARKRMDADRAVELYRQGKTIQQIAAELRREVKTVSYALNSKGIKRSPITAETLDLRQQVLQAHRTGLAPMAIALKLEVTRERVLRAMKALGVKPHKAKRVIDTEGFAASVHRLRREGLSIVAIAVALAVPKSRVERVLTGAAVRMEVAA